MTYPNQPPPPPPQTMGSSNTLFITETRFDPSFLKTPEGVLKLVIMILSLIGFICIQASAFWSNGRGVYFSFVANLAFWLSGIILLCYLYHVVEKYHNIKWLKIELIVNIVLVFLYVIASTIVVAFGSAAYSAAGDTLQVYGKAREGGRETGGRANGVRVDLRNIRAFFGYLAMVSCGGDAFLKARALRSGRLAQGSRVVAKQPHVLTPPALP